MDLDMFVGVAAEAWSAIAAWVGLFGLGAAAVYAKRQADESRRAREAQERPFVVVALEFRGTVAYVTITNFGRTVARDVQVRLDRPLQSATRHGAKPYEELKVFRDGIPNLVPGQKVEIFLDVFAARVKAGLPMTYVATASYSSHEGRPLGEERYVLDLETFQDTAVPPKGLSELVREVERIRQQVERWGTPTQGGLLAWVRDMDRDKRIADRPIRVHEAQRVRRERGRRAFIGHLVHRFLEKHGLYEWRD